MKTRIKEPKFENIALTKLEPSKLNVRTSKQEEDIQGLIDSIQEIGVQQPLVVVMNKEGVGYEVLIGQRRLIAARQLGLETVPCIIRDRQNPDDMLILSFSENIHRRELEYDDKMAAAMKLLADLKDEDVVAKKLGVSRQTLRKYLGWSVVPKEIKAMVNQKRLNRNLAIRLAGTIDDAGKIKQLADKIVNSAESELRNEIVVVASENPSESADEIERIAKARKRKKLSVDLDQKIAEALEKASIDYVLGQNEIAEQAIEEWLKRRNFL